MRFFDPKEEVIDLQLTQYGKQLLSQGKLKPVYYAFYDDDILYDLNYANASGSYEEIQNKSEDRITKLTPRTKVQYMFKSAEEPVFSTLTAKQTGINVLPSRPLSYNFGLPIGNSSLSSDFVPSWDISFLYGKLGESTMVHTGSYFKNIEIPQLEATCEFEAYTSKFDEVGNLVENFIPSELETIMTNLVSPGVEIRETFGDEDDIGESWPMRSDTPIIAQDNTTLQIKPDYLFLEVRERNTDFLKENFEIEVYEVVETGQNSKGEAIYEEVPLEFFDSTAGIPLGEQHVEYWFDITTDEDVPTEYFCASSVVAERVRNKLADSIMSYPEDCADFSDTKNLYIHDVIEEEEPC